MFGKLTVILIVNKLLFMFLIHAVISHNVRNRYHLININKKRTTITLS